MLLSCHIFEEVKEKVRNDVYFLDKKVFAWREDQFTPMTLNGVQHSVNDF